MRSSIRTPRNPPKTLGEWLQFGIGAVIVAGMCFPAFWMTYSSF